MRETRQKSQKLIRILGENKIREMLKSIKMFVFIFFSFLFVVISFFSFYNYQLSKVTKMQVLLSKSSIKEAQLIIANGFIMNKFDSNHETVLHKLMRRKVLDYKLIEFLISNGLKIGFYNYSKNSEADVFVKYQLMIYSKTLILSNSDCDLVRQNSLFLEKIGTRSKLISDPRRKHFRYKKHLLSCFANAGTI